ncbi:MFS transporter [Pseudonocardia sp. T1-2H]|uniref:MFS transporter n=1 Tax=Pseudonocardia sp. T1-2H TaxID=3128899 RepID=UPI0031016473
MSVPRTTSPASDEDVTSCDGQVRKLGIAGLLHSPGFARLMAVRLPAQWGDGMFQAALGGAVLFNPERQADPMAVAAGLAVMLLPYSALGPFAGALLDRWDRRRVLFVANLLRVVLIGLVAVAVGAGVAGAPLYLGALAVMGVNRFVLSGLSAALPHVVLRRHLVEANVLAVTIGAGIAALGGASAVGIRMLAGAGNAGSAITTALAAVGPLVAGLVAATFARKVLGPDSRDEPDRALTAVAHGFVDGARAVFRTPTVAATFLALAAHRLAFGVSTLVSLLLFRYAFTGSGLLYGGMAGLGEAVVAAAAGMGVAAFLTPFLVHRIGRPRTVRVALLVAAAAMVVVALTLSPPSVLAGAFVLSTAGQMVKLCADAGVQSETDDAVRGRVFALYDGVFNVCYVLAVTVAALLSPPDGVAPLLLGSAAAVYLVGLLAHDRLLRRRA